MRMTVMQCKAARAGLGWKVSDLAARADMGQATVFRYENEAPNIRSFTVIRIQKALEEAGVEFLADEGNGPGLRFTERAVDEAKRARETLYVEKHDELPQTLPPGKPSG